MAQAAGKSKKIKNDNLLVKLINGRLLSSDFFARHWKSVLLAILMVLIYITNRYQCLTRMEEIRRLEQELEVVETERIRVRSTYMSRIRESSMQEMVDTMHLNLRIQDKPPYKLSKH
ncbi:FtsL-like putative cell division protein [uncultured Muribaculum sp.]|uniref:FtsL-like putative cell division protein n=1 Tax=uncultured Muribaculum sp. TaxID=1918613 RepID=UPI00259C6DB6|nr:FtsL-like putative cell division protein [uncultured Muribaculum sp.]